MGQRLINWIDERSGLVGVLNAFLNRGVPRGVGWFYILGSATLLTLVVQVATGLALTLYYVPATDQAYESVQYITQQVLFGGFIRGLHHWAASAFVALLFLHLLRVLFFGAFKYPRELNWLFGVGLFFVGMGMALTGYLLPWDQRAYWGTIVSTEAAGSVPFIGPFILRVARGGAEVGAVTLTRFFSLHIMWLPLLVAALVGGHLYLVIRQGISNPPERNVKVPNDPSGYAEFYSERKKGGHAFYPEIIFKDTLAFLVIFAVLVVLAIVVGAPTEAKADPAAVNYVPRPEWYFLFLFQFLRLLKPQWEIIGTTVLPLAAVVILLLLPWLDRNRFRHPLNRPIVSGLAGLAVIGLVFLSVEGALAPALETTHVARLVIPPLTPMEQQGRQVFQQYACTVCHAINGVGGQRGPDLAGVGAQLQPQQILSHLQPMTGTTIMPDYAIAGPDLLALTSYLLTLTTPPTAPVTPTVALPQGEAIYQASGCMACHTINGEGGSIGPDLSSVGATHDVAWLVQFLENPSVMLPGSRMPAHPLPPNEIQPVAEYLAGLKGGPQVASAALGQSVYSDQGCAVCHTIQGKGGSVGPDLTRIGDRLGAQQITQFIHDPKSVNPSASMPPYGNLSDVQLQSLADYLLSLVGKAPTPAATVAAPAATPASTATVAAPATTPASTATVAAPAATPASTATVAAPAATSMLTTTVVATPATTATEAPPVGAPTTGPTAAVLWATNCALCHGDRAQGGAVFKRPIDIAAQTDAQVRSLIEQGRGSMPPFGGRLSAGEIDAIITLVRSWQASPPSATTATAVAPSAPTTVTVAAVASVTSTVAATPAAPTTATATAAVPTTSTATAAVTSTTTVAAGAPSEADAAAVWAKNCAVCHGDKAQGGAMDKEPIDLSNRTDAQAQTLIEQGRGGMPAFGTRLSSAEIAALVVLLRGWRQ